MRQRDRRRRREAREIGRLQIPVQRFFEPEDAVRLYAMGKLDAVSEIVGRVHVEHQLRLLADGGAHRANPLDIGGDAAEPGLQLDGAITQLDELCHLFGIGRVRRARPVIAAGRIRDERPVLAAEQSPDRQTGGPALQIPKRDIDPGDCCHNRGALAARHRRRQPVLALDDAGPRRRQREEPSPHRFMRQRIHAVHDLSETRDPVADARYRRAMDFTIPGEPVIGFDRNENDRPRLQFLMRGPHRLRPRHRDRIRRNRRDAHH